MTWLSVLGYVLLSIWSTPSDFPSPEKPETVSSSSVTDKDTASLSLFYYECEAITPQGGRIDISFWYGGNVRALLWESWEQPVSEVIPVSFAPCNLRDQITTLLFPFHTFW